MERGCVETGPVLSSLARVPRGAPPMRGKVAVFALSLQLGIFTFLLGKEKALKYSKLRFFFYGLRGLPWLPPPPSPR